MSLDTENLEFLTAEQKETIVAVREHLLSIHNIDTASLDEIEMTARMAAILEIAKSRNIDSSHLPQILSELSDKFMDFNALVMEMVMAADAARHQ
jgi:hypothetical protein